MKPEKPKKRPSKAKLAKRQKSSSKASLASSGKTLSAAVASADDPATSLIWSTTGPTDNDSVEGNAAMTPDQTGRSDLATQATRGDAGRSDTTSRSTARQRRRHTRHRERHGSGRERKTSSERESPPEDRRPKRVEVTHAAENATGSTDTGERSTQPRPFDLKRQAEGAVGATQKDLGGQVVTSVRGYKQGVTRFQQVSAPAGGERREVAMVSGAAAEVNKAKHSVADAARSQIDVNRAGNTVAEGAVVGVHCAECKTGSPSTKLSERSPTFEGHANVGASSGSPPMAEGHTTPPCNPCIQQRWSTAPRASTADVWQSRRQGGVAKASESTLVDVSEEDYYGDLCPDLSPDASTRTGVTAAQFYETTTSSVESKQCRSLGQSWISHVGRDMNGGATPHKSTVMALLKKEMAKKTPAKVVPKLGSPSISWESEHNYEPVAIEIRSLPTQTQPQSKAAKAAKSGGERKGDYEANAARPAEIASEVSYGEPSLTVKRESKGKQVTRFAPRNSLSRVSVSRPSVSKVSVSGPSVSKVSVSGPSASRSRVSRASIRGPVFKQILFPLTTFSVLILLAFAIAFLAPLKHSHSKTILVDQLAAACAGDQACIRAVKAMTGSLDLAADPCLEFDRFVCGNWRAFDPHRRSYRRESVRNYTRSIREALLRVLAYDTGSPRGRGMDEGGDVTNMATFYSTCQAFAEEHNTTRITTASDVINAMYLHHGTTSCGNETARTDLRSLLQFAVSRSFKNGLPTIVSVTLKGEETFLDVGETLRSTLGPSLIVEDFLRETLGSLGSADDNETVGVLLSADGKASDWRSRVSTSDPFNRTRLKHLHPLFPSADWAKALNQGVTGNASEYSPDSVVYARGMAEVSEIMTMFSKDNLTEHACAYASAVLVAQVMKYKYLFRGPGAYNQTTAPEGADLCLEVTGTYFKDLLPHWVTTALASNQRMRAFRNMMESLQRTIARRSLHSKSMMINGSEFSKLNFIITGESSLTSHRQPAPMTSPSSHYGDQFLLNVVLASRDHVGIDYDEGAVEQQLSGNLSFFSVDEQQFVAVPANFIDSDSLVAYDNVPSIDYASIGVRLLLEWLEWTFPVENTSGHPVAKAPEQRIRERPL
ncbi:hypothetical protein MTO96_022773 [Rhipicephalus appendiculatus]